MSSEIRALLAAAQDAEARGDVARAVVRLQEAADFYRARRMERRAAQMERHIDRLEGRAVPVRIDPIHDPGIDIFDEDDEAVAHVLLDAPFEGDLGAGPLDEGLGFGDELLGRASSGAMPSLSDDRFGDGPSPIRASGSGVSERFGDGAAAAPVQASGSGVLDRFGDATGPGPVRVSGSGVKRFSDSPAPETLRASGSGVRARAGEPGVGLSTPGGRPLDDPRFDRGPQPADPAIDAWCSFCCRPRGEVGALIAGPAGAFICGGCLVVAGRLMALPMPTPLPQSRPSSRSRVVAGPELPAQAHVRSQLERRRPKVALVLGPEGAGKSVLLERLGRPAARPFVRVDGDSALVDLSTPLTPEEESALQAWLDGHPDRRAVLATRGAAPTPVLVLQGEHGEEPVYDTASIHQAVASHLSPSILSRVDSVLPLPAPDRAALRHLAQSLLAARDVELPEDALESIVGLAERSGRGARELAALIARIPAGRYKAP